MALTTGILIAKFSVKGHAYETLVLVDDAAVIAAWTQLKTTTPGYLADGTRLKAARLFNPAVYSPTGDLVPTQSTLSDEWNDPADDVDYTTAGALGDPGTCAQDILRLASNVADAETFTLVGVGQYAGITEVYEFTDDGALANPTNIPINISGGVTPTIVSPLIVAAINGNSKLGIFAEAISVNEIAVRKMKAGVDTTGATTTMAGVNNAWGSATFYGGKAPISSLRREAFSRVPTAQEVAIGNMHFEYDFQPQNPIVQIVVTASGLPVEDTCDRITDGNRLTIHNTGGTDYSTSHTVIVTVTD